MDRDRHVEEQLAAYRDLDDVEKRRVEQHVAKCAECAETLAAYQAMDRALANLPAPQPDKRLQKGFYAAINRNWARKLLTRIRRLFAWPSTPDTRHLLRFSLSLSATLLILLAAVEAIHLLQANWTVKHIAQETARFAVTYQPNQGTCMDQDKDRIVEDGIAHDPDDLAPYPYCPHPGYAADPQESEEAYYARRAALIKLTAYKYADGLRINTDNLGLTESAFREKSGEPGFFGVRLWGYPSFSTDCNVTPQACLDHPGLEGLAMMIYVVHNAEPLIPIFRPIVPDVKLSAQAQMINEGVQVGFGDEIPPGFGHDPNPIIGPPKGEPPSEHIQDEPQDLLSTNPISASERLIPKNTAIDLEVESIEQTTDEVNQIIDGTGGYLVSRRIWRDGEQPFASITIIVPSERHENVLRRLRDVSIQMLSEDTRGEDVTRRYTDLESHLHNLEATRDRVQALLDQAQTGQETAEINQKLDAVQEEIEQTQSELYTLHDQSAFSTIVINLSQTPLTPQSKRWQPGKTVRQAIEALLSTGQFLIDALIWIGLVIGPFFVFTFLIVWGVAKLIRWTNSKRTRKGQGKHQQASRN